MTNSYDPNATLDFSYDTEEVQAEIKREAEAEQMKLARQQAENAEKEQPAAAPTPEPTPEEPSGEFMDDLVQPFKEQAEGSINDMGGRQRAVAGTIDLAMDGISKLIPALTPAADWWDEQSGRKEERSDEENLPVMRWYDSRYTTDWWCCWRSYF